MSIDDKTSETISNICTILGGALLLFPIIDQATKTLIPEMQKLTSGEMAEEIKALPLGKEESKEESPKQDEQSKPEEHKDHEC